jgi:hypothetical protein
MNAWKNPAEQLPPEDTDVIVFVQGIFAVASWSERDQAWCCAVWDDPEGADFVDLWADIPPFDSAGPGPEASHHSGTSHDAPL